MALSKRLPMQVIAELEEAEQVVNLISPEYSNQWEEKGLRKQHSLWLKQVLVQENVKKQVVQEEAKLELLTEWMLILNDQQVYAEMHI